MHPQNCVTVRNCAQQIIFELFLPIFITVQRNYCIPNEKYAIIPRQESQG